MLIARFLTGIGFRAAMPAGIGAAIAVGRMGAIAGPIIMGMLMTGIQINGGDTGHAIWILIPASAVGLICVLVLLGRKAA